MSNSNKSYLQTRMLDTSLQVHSTKRTELFSDKNTRFESSFVGDKTNSTFTGMLPRQSRASSQVNHLFKIPNFDDLPIKKATVKSINSPRRRVQAGRVNDVLSKQSKMSLIPRPSFIASRKSLHVSRSSQIKARKELIKKMVFLAECSLKENKETKQSTPVKMLAGLTPRKTPRSGGYFILPEFSKKKPKLEDIRSPIQDLVKKEMFSYSAKCLFEKKNVSPVKPKQDDLKPEMKNSPDTKCLIEENAVPPVEPKQDEVKVEVKHSPDKKNLTDVLSRCKTYNTEIRMIHERIRLVDDSFGKKLKDLPDYRVYNEFCFYQNKKEGLYKELHTLEVDFREFISRHTKVGNDFKAYLKKKEEIFEKLTDIHEDFEKAVNSAMGNCEKPVRDDCPKVLCDKPKAETPKLRRSLRLSKIKKSKFEEMTPMTRKLKRLDSKSKGIQRNRKARSP